MGNWATQHIERLQKGETVKFRPLGHSMKPVIESGQLVTVEPVNPTTLKEGDIVLCRVRGNSYLHFIKQILTIKDPKTGDPYTDFQIGNNRGGLNGWISSDMIYGKCTKVEA
jgi:exosome complex RNA-binding protein Csl4